jgi:hypothetical protein
LNYSFFFVLKSLQLNLPDLCAYGEIDWINMHLFLLGKNQQRLKSYCFVFRNGCLILVREQSNKKKQVGKMFDLN